MGDRLDWYVGEDRRLKVQPDIAGLKGDALVVACEISATSFETDTNAKMAVYKALKVPFYIVVDCYEKSVLSFEIDSKGGYVRGEKFSGLDDFVKKNLES